VKIDDLLKLKRVDEAIYILERNLLDENSNFDKFDVRKK
jgi:hypothetical protein